MKVEEIIRIQEQSIEFLKAFDPSCPLIENSKIIILALEKQIPKEPVNDYCPDCSTYLRDDNGVEGGYCPNCGQAINW